MTIDTQRLRDRSLHERRSTNDDFELLCRCADHIDDQAAEIERLRQPWISVNERLPDTEELVLVFVPGARYQKVGLDCWRMQHESPVEWSSVTIETGMAWDEHEFEEVTHWMPLPAAPCAALSQEPT